MELIHSRYATGKEATVSKLWDGTFLICRLVEDQYQDGVKVPGETCIPCGRYKLELRTEGGMHARYSERFPGIHRGMLWLQDVPGFTWIYYHIGNDDDESLGCPLVATRIVEVGEDHWEGRSSTDAYLKLIDRVHAAWDRGEEVWVTVTDHEIEL